MRLLVNHEALRVGPDRISTPEKRCELPFQTSGSVPPCQLRQFFPGHRASLVEVVRQILQMDAFGAFLAVFHAHEWQGDITRTEFAKKFQECQM